MDKRKHILGLSKEEVLDLLLKLLPNFNNNEVSRENGDSIVEKVDVGASGNFKNYYKVINKKLTKGDEDVDTLTAEIEKKITSGISKVIIVSNDSISTGFKTELERKLTSKDKLDFWEREDLIKNIEKYYKEYWRHNDLALIAYEKRYENCIKDSFQIKKLVEFKATYQKLLEIFIEPRLFLRTEDKQSNKKAFTKINIERAIKENDRLLLLHGDPGTGKTRLLNEIGRALIAQNSKISGNRYLPVFLDSIAIRNAFKDDIIDLLEIIVNSKLNDDFANIEIDTLFKNYKLVILIDSIDEFDKKHRALIIEEIEKLMDKGAIMYLGTRSNTLDSLFNGETNPNKKDVFIQKFDDEQVQKFTSRYFEGNGDRAQGLLNSMAENKILEKLPLTPLNMSLMSILYEETNQEIPATLNDIYDKFSNLLLGRTMVDKSILFLDITIKENILQTYALELLKRKNSELMTKTEFVDFFKNELKSISGTISMDKIPDALDYIIEHTGLLTLHNGKYVKFRHDSYMEYYAAKEIFYNRRELQVDLVDNFFDVNWQYAAVFYGGMSRKMPAFLDDITKKIAQSSTMREYWSAANGMGYLLQALYLTNDDKRKEGVLETLKVMVKTYQGFKLLSSSLPEKVSFGRFSLPVLSIFPFFLFLDNFDSITLRQPLNMALDQLLNELEEKKKIKNYPYIDNITYQILILAVTMSSERLNEEDRLTEVIDKVKTVGNSFYTKLLEGAIDTLGNSELHKQKQELLYPKKVAKNTVSLYHTKKSIDNYLKPARRQRFGKYDKIVPNNNVKIFVEGKTDAEILEHAFFILTGQFPYWEIRVGGGEDGGANQLAKALNEGISYLEEDQMVIGLFDNDRKGIPEFKGALKPAKFDYMEGSQRIKKRKNGNIYALLLPVPEKLQYYIQENQDDNYFAIEHYLSNELLQQEDMLVETAIPNIFKINDKGGAKNSFAHKLLQYKDIKVFNGFIPLFKEIDSLAGMKDEINYKE